MPFITNLNTLIDTYIADPSSITIEDIKPLIRYIEQHSIAIPPHLNARLHKQGETLPASTLSATHFIRGNSSGLGKTSIVTIGVHGNEIYAGAICALEILKAQKQNKLEGNVVLQLGNVKAINGFLNSYDSMQDFSERAGWRATYGDQLGTHQVTLPSGQILSIKDDMNRPLRNAMFLPRGQSPNIDRSQEIVWTARAVEQGLLPDHNNILSPSSQSTDIGFIIHPHTSRSPNGITNLSIPPRCLTALKQGTLGRPFIHTPSYMMNIINWSGHGLGGADHTTMSDLIAQNINAQALIVTVELGNHEDVKTPQAPSLINTAQIFTAGLLQTTKMVAADFLKTAYNSKAHKHEFTVYKADPVCISLKEFDGFAALKSGDILYPVRAMDAAERQSLSLLEISHEVILVNAHNKIEILSQSEAMKSRDKIGKAHEAYYKFWPLELEHIKKGETLMLCQAQDGRVNRLKAPRTFHAIFPWINNKSFPLSFDPHSHTDLRLYFTAEQETTLTLPETQPEQKITAKSHKPVKPTGPNPKI